MGADFSRTERDDTVTAHLPPPPPEEFAWLLHMAAIEDEMPFPGVGCRPPRRAPPLRHAADALVHAMEITSHALVRPPDDLRVFDEMLARLSLAANTTQTLLLTGEAA